MTIQEWQSLGRHHDFQGHQIFYRDGGTEDKPALVLLHGFPTASWDWHKMWHLLKKDFRLVCLDFLGFGFSDKPRPHNYSIHQQADITQHLLAALGVKEFHLLAHDYGVSVAQELLARQVEQGTGDLQSIAFLNGGLFAEMHRPLLIQKMMLSPLGSLLPPFLGKSALRKNFKRIFGPDTSASEEEIQAFWELLNYNKGKWIFHRLIRYMLDRRRHRDRWVLPLIHPSIPVRLINGNLDPISGKHTVEHYRKLYPEADCVSLPRIGHYPNTEAAAEAVHYYLEFFEKIN